MDNFTAEAKIQEKNTIEAKITNVKILQNNSNYEIKIGKEPITESAGGLTVGAGVMVVLDSNKDVYVKSNTAVTIAFSSEVM